MKPSLMDRAAASVSNWLSDTFPDWLTTRQDYRLVVYNLWRCRESLDGLEKEYFALMDEQYGRWMHPIEQAECDALEVLKTYDIRLDAFRYQFSVPAREFRMIN